MSEFFQAYMKQHGILHQSSCVNSPLRIELLRETIDKAYTVLFLNTSPFLVEPKIFGSTCFVLDVRPFDTNLDPKILKCVFQSILAFKKTIDVSILNLGNILCQVMWYFQRPPFFYVHPNSTSQEEENEWLLFQVTQCFDKTISFFSLNPNSSMDHDSLVVPSLYALERPPIVQVYSRRRETTDSCHAPIL